MTPFFLLAFALEFAVQKRRNHTASFKLKEIFANLSLGAYQLFEAAFNRPSHHRVHHGRNPEYIDKNYGGTLIIFDRLFGTFEPEVAKAEFGITQQINSYNPVVLNIHEAVDMLRDVMAPGPVAQRMKHLIMPPDWEREGHTPIRTWSVTPHSIAVKDGASNAADLSSKR